MVNMPVVVVFWMKLDFKTLSVYCSLFLMFFLHIPLSSMQILQDAAHYPTALQLEIELCIADMRKGRS